MFAQEMSPLQVGPVPDVLDYAALSRTFTRLQREACLPEALRAFGLRLEEDVVFRAADDGDAVMLTDLFNEPETGAEVLTRGPFHSPDEFQTWRLSLHATVPYEIVAQQGNAAAGFVGLYPQPDQMGHTGVVTLLVGEAYRRRGIGRTLMQLAIATGWLAAGLEKIQLTVFTDNRPALHLYESLGFCVEGRLRRFVKSADGPRDAYAMALFLD